jgi:hypothetical protein
VPWIGLLYQKRRDADLGPAGELTPQSNFMLLAPIAPAQEARLRDLLASMNLPNGLADPENPLIPFGAFDRLHLGRFVILQDDTSEDLVACGLSPRPFPRTLAFFGDIDGDADSFLAELSVGASAGLRQIFACCEGFQSGADLLDWMRRHNQSPAAAYVNGIGRTVRQVREEDGLYKAVSAHIDANAARLASQDAQGLRAAIAAFVDAERKAGRLALSPPAATPLGWHIGNLANLVGAPLALLLLSPLLLLALPFYIWALRSRELTDPEITPRPDPARVGRITPTEDHDVTNPYLVLGSLKPGLFRRWNAVFLLWLLDYFARHVYTSGRLGRVRTIHFARFVFVDDRRRMMFISNYDGTLDAYMDDFVNKVGWGLNLMFSNGLGYPRTEWVLDGGAKLEQKFKYYVRRHQLPTAVWYKAYPGLTIFDMTRNTLLRKGLERPSMNDAEAAEWLALL